MKDSSNQIVAGNCPALATVPIALRFWVAHRRELLNAVVAIASRAISRHY